MTFGQHLLRGAALSALAVGLTTTSASAQNGSNFQVYSNTLDAIYAGIGAGGAQTALDGMLTWLNGEDLKGATMTALGDWGYKQVGWRESMCVLGSAVGTGSSIEFPGISMIELDGRNAHTPDVFTAPNCLPPGTPSFIPYGAPAGSSANFVLFGYPSGVGISTALPVLLPNNGLVPSTLGGTATIIAAGANISIPIASTGFCWVVQFTWVPSALASLDDIDGWQHYLHNSGIANQQYWGMSNDEMNTWQSQSIVLDGGATGLIGFTSSLDYEYHSFGADPSSNSALQPAGSNGTGTYYATTVDAGGGNPGGPTGAGVGFDLGRHVAWSQSGTGGAINPATGLGTQNPAGSPIANQIPTVGIATWNNQDYDGDGDIVGTPPVGGFRLTWLTIDWDASFGVNPALAGEATKWFGQVRIPSTIPASAPVPWPQTLTTTFFPFLVHNTVNHDTSGAWPDPNGFPSGTFGVPGVSGTSIHVPIVLGSTCVGVPIAVQHGTSGLGGPGGPLVWNPGANTGPTPAQKGNRASHTAQLYYID